MEKNSSDEVEDVLYRIGEIVLLIAILFVSVATLLHIPLSTILGDTFGSCPFYRLTHFYCPACGGTRAVISFFQGKWISSVRYNAFVFYILFGFMAFMISHTVHRITNKRVRGIKFHIGFIYLGLVIALAQWIIKNAEVLF